jgi:hypothetical protein
MRWNDGDIDLDADELGPDDSDAGDIVFDADDPSICDSEWEKSLLSEWVEGLKDRDVSFRVPVLDLSNCDEVEVTAAAWLKSPRMMLETLAARLNEVIERCNLLPVRGLVFEVKRECFSYPGLSDLYNLSCTLHICGLIVDYVNSIQPTPLKGEILVQLGKSVLPGRTPELNRCIDCCKRELTKLAKWIKIKEIQNSDNPPVDPRTPRSPKDQHQTVRGTVVLESELTRDERDGKQWCIILGYAKDDHTPISKTSFHNRIKGKGPNPLDAVVVRGQKYRLRTNQLPTAANTESARNAIIEAVPPSKRGRKKG